MRHCLLRVEPDVVSLARLLLRCSTSRIVCEWKVPMHMAYAFTERSSYCPRSLAPSFKLEANCCVEKSDASLPSPAFDAALEPPGCSDPSINTLPSCDPCFTNSHYPVATITETFSESIKEKSRPIDLFDTSNIECHVITSRGSIKYANQSPYKVYREY
jgi:hypothetical protein